MGEGRLVVMAGMALLLVLAAVVGVTSAQVDRGVEASQAVPTISAPSAKDVVQSAFTNISKTSTSRNPCLYINGGCHKDAICSTDDQGEAICTCPPSHTGDGKNCTQLEGCYPGVCGDNATCLEDGDLAYSLACAMKGSFMNT